jgi:hypothetical protein
MDENNTVVKLDDAKHAEPMETSVEGSHFTQNPTNDVVNLKANVFVLLNELLPLQLTTESGKLMEQPRRLGK